MPPLGVLHGEAHLAHVHRAADLPAARDLYDALDCLHGHGVEHLELRREPVAPRRNRAAAGEVRGAFSGRVDDDPAEGEILHEVVEQFDFVVGLGEFQGSGDHLGGVEEVHPEGGAEEPPLVGFGSDDAGKDGFALVVYVHGGDELRRRRCRWLCWDGIGRGVVEGGEGVGEDGAVGGGEGGDGGRGEGIVERRPRGGADVTPEVVFGAEAAEVRGGGSGGSEGGAVEAIKDVGLKDVGVDGGDVRRG